MGVCFFSFFFFLFFFFALQPSHAAKVRSASHIDPELLLNFYPSRQSNVVAAVELKKMSIHTCMYPSIFHCLQKSGTQ